MPPATKVCWGLRSPLLALLAAIACAISSGCLRAREPASTAGPHSVRQFGAPRFIDPATGMVLQADTIVVDLGRVRVTDAVRREVLIRNDGPATFSVNAVQAAPDFPADFEYSSSPFGVAPGKQYALDVRFRPTAAGSLRGTLHLAIVDGDRSALTIELSGTGYHGESPELEVAPQLLYIDDVELTRPQVRHLVLANVGVDVPGTATDNLRFDTAPEVTGADAAEFSLEWPPAGYRPDGLAAGETADLSVTLDPVSLGEKRATLILHTNDPRQLRVEVPLLGRAVPQARCDLAVSPASLNFGSVDANKYLTLTFSIINRDQDPRHKCTISSLEIPPASYLGRAFALVNGPVRDAPTPSGGVLSIPVRFAPKAPGSYSGEIVIAVDPPMASPLTVRLSAVASDACLMVAPRELDFGAIAVGCDSKERVFTVYNTCASNVVVDSIRTVDSSEFVISRVPALPVMIAGGASADFGVKFRPAQAADASAEIAVSHVGAANPQLIKVTGKGTGGATQTDTFEQGGAPKVDILFVIDNSSTMADKQTALASNLSSFIAYAVQQPVDYHIAVTTTDVTATGEAGRLLPITGTSPRVVTPSTTDGTQVFTQNAAVGTNGSETESLIRPAYLALTNPLINGHNAGFFRDEARLAIIIISDAADQDPLTTPVSFYVSFFLQFKVRRSFDISVSAIIPTQSQAPAGCTYDTVSAGLDTRVSQLVQRAGGLLGDICDANWGNVLPRLGSRLFARRATFFLSNTPDMSITPIPISIAIDNVPMPQYSPLGEKRWDFVAANNAVTVHRYDGSKLGGCEWESLAKWAAARNSRTLRRCSLSVATTVRIRST